MTERDWLSCASATPMVKFLLGKSIPENLTVGSGRVIQVSAYPQSRISHRKLRLFACACCRRIWHLLLDQRSRDAVEVSEQYADGQATEQQLKDAGVAADAVTEAAYHAVHDPMEAEAVAAGLPPEEWVHGAWEIASDAASAPSSAAETTRLRAADLAALAGWEAAGRAVSIATNDWAAQKGEQRVQAEMLRCITGNPFRSTSVKPTWLAWSDGIVVQLAHGIYDDRAFDRLPILADALEEAGCSDTAMLDHCRQPGSHARGCWVVDLLTGRR